MAKQVGPHFFTGRRGNEIGYKRNGQFFTRAMPEEVKQSDATKKASVDFGLTSKTGKLIRNAVFNEIGIPWDGTITNRINQVLVPVILTPGFSLALQGFCFNDKTPLDNILKQTSKLERKRDGTFLIKVPEQHIKKSRGATHLEIKAISVSIHFAKRKHETLDTDILNIDLKEPFKGADLKLRGPGMYTTIIILQAHALQLVNGQYYELTDLKYCSAEIIKVIPEKVIKKTAGKKKILPEKKHINKRRPPKR